MDRILRIVPPPAAGPAPDLDDDEQLVAAIRARQPGAFDELMRRHGTHLRRVLMRVMGSQDADTADIMQEVAMSAWQGIGSLADARALKAWLTRIAIFTARGVIRRRSRSRWLAFLPELPDKSQPWAGPEMQEAARAVYAIFDRMPVDERIPFALRMLEDLDLEATAEACGMSLATVRRRLVKAERRFRKMAKEHEALGPWLEETAR